MPIIVDPSIPNPPTPEVIVSPDQKLIAVAGTYGVQLRADFSNDDGTWPDGLRKVRFERDGQPIRSGNTAWAIGGIADAFDYEIAPGQVAIYQAFPLDIDEEPFGDPTEALAITAMDIHEDYDCWLKSISDPSLMARFEMQGDPEFTEQGADTLEKPFGASLYAGGIDTAALADAPFVFKVTGKAELDLLLAIIESGVVLWQSDGRAGLDNFYGVRQTASWQYMVGSQKLVWLVSVTFRKVAQPSTYGAPLVIPGYSYADTQATAATFADREKIFPAFENTIGQPVQVPS